MINPLYKTPFQRATEWWNYVFEDPIKQKYDLLNTPYITRQAHADVERRFKHFNDIISRNEGKVHFYDVLEDNFLRFTALGFLERLSVLRQTSLFSGSRQLSGRDGVFSGLNRAGASAGGRAALRGNFLSFLQFAGVHYQALTLSNKNLPAFMFNLVLLDAILHPLDTLRTRYQADVRGSFKSFADVCAKTSPTQLYNGVVFKAGFTGLMALYFSSASATCYASVPSVALLAAAYPFLTLKSIAQVTNTAGTFAADFGAVRQALGGEAGPALVRTLYRGFVPFLALNLLAPYTFPQLWTQGKMAHVHEEFNAEAKQVADVSQGRY
jgi:hypothetical protein